MRILLKYILKESKNVKKNLSSYHENFTFSLIKKYSYIIYKTEYIFEMYFYEEQLLQQCQKN